MLNLKLLKTSLVVVCSGLLLSGCSLQDLQSLKAKSGLQVVTEVTQSASLFLNGEYLDKTPYINKNIKPGTYSLKIQPTDKSLASYETQITLTQGALTVVTWNPGKTPESSGGVIYELADLPSGDKTKAEIVLTTIPDTAILTFDSQPQTFSPATLSGIEPGNHEFEVKLPSYQTQKHTLNAVAGKRLNVTVKLAKEPLPGSVSAEPSPTPVTATSSAIPTNPKSLASSSAITQASLAAKLKPTDSNQASGSSTLTGPRVLIKSTGYLQNQKEVLRVRAEANPQAGTVGWADVGKEYKYLGKHTDGWYQIELQANQIGWVSEQYSQLEN
jgi:hypothetical protein